MDQCSRTSRARSGGSWPGRAHFCTVNEALNVPVVEVAAVAFWVVLKSTVTVSLTPNPEPDTLTLVVGGRTSAS